MAPGRGLYAQARARYEHALSLARSRAAEGYGHSPVSIGETALARRELQEAARRYHEALSLAIELGDRVRVAYVLEGFASLAASERQPARALMLSGAAAGLRSAIRTPLPPSEAKRLDQRLSPARQALGREAVIWFDRGYALPPQDAVTMLDAASDHHPERRRALQNGSS